MNNVILPIGSMYQVILLRRNNYKAVHKMVYTDYFRRRCNIPLVNSGWANDVGGSHSFILHLVINGCKYTTFTWNRRYSNLMYDNVHMNKILIHVKDNGEKG